MLSFLSAQVSLSGNSSFKLTVALFVWFQIRDGAKIDLMPHRDEEVGRKVSYTVLHCPLLLTLMSDLFEIVQRQWCYS